MTLRALTVLAALCAGLLLVAACGGDEDDARSPVTTSTPAANATTSTDQPPAPNPGGAPAPSVPGAATPVTVPPLVDPEAIEAWAVETCATLEAWTAAIDAAESAEAVDGGPASLPLEERIARSARLSAAERAASEAAATAMREKLPPFEVAEYADVVADQFEGRVAAVDDLEARLATATSVADFDAATAEYDAAVDQRNRVVTAASQFLPTEAVAALTSQSCGYLTR